MDPQTLKRFSARSHLQPQPAKIIKSGTTDSSTDVFSIVQWFVLLQRRSSQPNLAYYLKLAAVAEWLLLFSFFFSWKPAHIKLLSYVLLPSLLGLTFSNIHLSHIHQMAHFLWPNLLFFPTIDPDFSSALAKRSCRSHVILMPLLERSQKPCYFSCVPCLLYFLPSIYPSLHPVTHKFSLAWTRIMPI